MTLKQLRAAITLRHRVTIYVPSQRSDGAAWDPSEAIDATATLLSKLFGGATSSPARGYWVHSDGRLAKESVTLVFAFATELTDESVDSLYTHCVTLKTTAKQEAVALEIDGELHLI